MLASRKLSLCLLFLTVFMGLSAAAVFLLDRGPDSEQLALRQESLSGEPQAAFDRADYELLNSLPGLTFRVSEGRLLDVRYRDPGPDPAVEIAADEVLAVELDSSSWPPLFADLYVQGLQVTLLSTALPSWLRRLRGDGRLAYVLHPESDTLEVRQLSLQAEDLGRLDLAAVLDSIVASDIAGSLPAAKLSTMTLDFRDGGLFDLTLADLARSEGIGEAPMRRQLIAMTQVLEAEAGTPILRETLGAIRAIADHEGGGQALQMTATPSKPFPLKDLDRIRGYPLPNLGMLNRLNLRIDLD
ncbi:MAG: hypothetical protein Kilf2KO_18820 [Rhodospirillales bacterium]